MSNIFCLWSGGLDSSYMIDQLLREGNDVVAGYCNINEGHAQSNREDFAREAMGRQFRAIYGDGRFSCVRTFDFGIHSVNQEFPIKQAFVWLMSYISIPNNSHKLFDSVAIGYTMNDDALSYIDELKASWNTFNSFSRKKVDLIFPLLKCKKSDMWESCPSYISDHVTWCESSDIRDFCEECHSCKRMTYEIPNINSNIQAIKKLRHIKPGGVEEKYGPIIREIDYDQMSFAF